MVVMVGRRGCLLVLVSAESGDFRKDYVYEERVGFGRWRRNGEGVFVIVVLCLYR